MNTERMQAWLDAVAAEEPGPALQIILHLAEFIVPKLARTEHVGEDGGPVRIEWPLPRP